MFESSTIAILVALVGAWALQVWLSNGQMRRFHKRSQELRRMGAHMAIGVTGNMYRRKTYVALVIDDDNRTVAAEELSGFTIFAGLQPIDGVEGIHIETIGRGDPPDGISPKTWAALDHAAGFIRKKLAREGGHDAEALDIEEDG